MRNIMLYSVSPLLQTNKILLTFLGSGKEKAASRSNVHGAKSYAIAGSRSGKNTVRALTFLRLTTLIVIE